MDAVSAFAIAMFALAWYFRSRTSEQEPLVRLFFGSIMVFAAASGFLGWALRLLTRG